MKRYIKHFKSTFPIVYRYYSLQIQTKLPLSAVEAQSILTKYYRNISPRIPKEEKDLINQNREFGMADAYADSHGSFISNLIFKLKINENDVIVDLGSGLGKVCLQFGLQSNAKKVIGVELSQTRHSHASHVLSELHKIGLKVPVEFYCDNLMNYQLWKDATIIYMWPVCFTFLIPSIIKLAREHCKDLKYIVSYGEAIPKDLCKEYKIKFLYKDTMRLIYKLV